MEVADFSEYKAKQLVEDGKHLISIGDLDAAIETFKKSLQLQPTAEGFTYLGWILSLKGHTDEAIDLCKQAILIDPEFGNPFNDIGNYLIQKNELDNAIPWLEQAIKASRYEPRHFPHINLGRIYSAQGRVLEAIDEFKKALEHAPEHPEILKVIEQLEDLQN